MQKLILRDSLGTPLTLSVKEEINSSQLAKLKNEKEYSSDASAMKFIVAEEHIISILKSCNLQNMLFSTVNNFCNI